MTNDYIRREDAVSAVEFEITLASAINIETGEWTELFQRENDELRKAVERIKGIEPADVAPVVRCKDCKHFYFADNRIPQEQRYVCEISGEIWKPDSFCSYGERREE